MAIKLCRACLAAEENFTYFLIDNVSPDMYMYCTSIEVKPEENLSRAICNTCYNLLLKFFDFKQTCIKSQNILLSCNLIVTDIKINDKHVNNGNSNGQEYFKDLDEDHSDHVDSYDCKFEVTKNEPVKQESIPVDFTQETQLPSLHLEHHKTIRRAKRKKGLQKQVAVKSRNISKSNESKKCLKCNVCNKRFYSTEGYELHKLEHTHNNSEETAIQCTTCNKSFMTTNGLRKHLNSTHRIVNLENLKCKICGKISKTKDTLRMHMKIHETRKLHVCDVCGKSYTTIHNLTAHIETHKANRERQFTCEHCGKKFFTHNILLTHVSRLHTGKRYICAICNYPFTEKYNLVKHLQIHEGKKPYKCDICLKFFGTKGTLVEHRRIHTGEKPFQCQYCPKTFLSKRRLTDHHRIHTGDKPYKCTVCAQAFAQCGSLNRHMKVHE